MRLVLLALSEAVGRVARRADRWRGILDRYVTGECGDREGDVRAFNEGDLDSVVGAAHPEIELRPAVTGGLEGTVYRGREGVRQFLGDIDAAWAVFRAEPEEFRDLGDTVVVLGRTAARGIRSGVELDTAGGWVLTLRDGQLHSFRSFVSKEAALEAAGLSE
jgi:ketosteroid isomerase-like protein